MSSITSSSNSSTWNIIEPWPNPIPGLGYDYTTNTSSTGILTLPNYKKCRNCHHAHLVANDGCIEVIGLNNSVTFISCDCKEYVPKDNLEYLEYLDKKKEQK